jgi:mRNA-degrading endonuclease RelE of RelBE toxin-antitoxin system
MFGNFFKAGPRRKSALLPSIRAAIAEQQKGAIWHQGISDFQESVENLWGGADDHRHADDEIDSNSSGLLDLTREPDDASLGGILHSVEAGSRKQETHWSIGMSSVFASAVSRMDHTLKERILDAISDLSGAPTNPDGDTIKPLGGEMMGLWRYRIDDYRLVYQPDVASRRVTLLAFGARG